MDWDLFWAWTGDASVWEWWRTVLAALLGGAIGGIFAIWAQSRSANAQSALQKSQLAAVEKADDAQATREATKEALANSRDDARRLFELFTSLHRSIQASALSLSDHLGNVSWRPRWREIWTKDIALEIDVLAALLVDDESRRQVGQLVDLLDHASNLDRDSGTPVALNQDLYDLTLGLTGRGIGIMARHLRGKSSDEEAEGTALVIASFSGALARYREWEADMIRRDNARAEAQADEPETVS